MLRSARMVATLHVRTVVTMSHFDEPDRSLSLLHPFRRHCQAARQTKRSVCLLAWYCLCDFGTFQGCCPCPSALVHSVSCRTASLPCGCQGSLPCMSSDIYLSIVGTLAVHTLHCKQRISIPDGLDREL